MINIGIAPPVPGTLVTEFRWVYGDTNYEDLVPPQPGLANYEKLSDAEIEQFLATGGGSVNRAIGYLYLRLASDAAMESVSIKDNDLSVDQTKRAADLRAIAELWFDRADDEDLADAEGAFEIVPTGTSSGDFIPELAPPIWGREYTWGVWRR